MAEVKKIDDYKGNKMLQVGYVRMSMKKAGTIATHAKEILALCQESGLSMEDLRGQTAVEKVQEQIDMTL